jgi:hypothetical protein
MKIDIVHISFCARLTITKSYQEDVEYFRTQHSQKLVQDMLSAYEFLFKDVHVSKLLHDLKIHEEICKLQENVMSLHKANHMNVF